MMQNDTSLYERFCGRHASPWLLIGATLLLLLFLLGGRNLWTLEWRWANIAQEMVARGNYLHSFLQNKDYYDKPLLSYWVTIVFSWLIDGLNTWAIRLPSALSGMLTIWCTFWLGNRLFNREVAYLAAWLLLTTLFFVFWSRTAGVEIINIAGIMLALVCYVNYRDEPTLGGYTLFFIIIALSCLMKGLVAACVVILAILPDLIKEKRWKKHLNWQLFVALLPALIIYFLPFALSSLFGDAHYQESGLMKVFRANFVRYFAAFDPKNPFYIYFYYMPIYTFPWIIAFIPALYLRVKRWSLNKWPTQWMWWVVLLIMLFFIGSGARRSYDIIPIIPFVILVTAEWLSSKTARSLAIKKLLTAGIIGFYLFAFAILALMYPLSNKGGGQQTFANTVQQAAIRQHTWRLWHFVMFQTDDRVSFYLNSPNLVTFIDSHSQQSLQQLKTAINKYPQLTIIISNAAHVKTIKSLGRYKILKITPDYAHRWLPLRKQTMVAMIPIEQPGEDNDWNI